jgi:hypothetical protein
MTTPGTLTVTGGSPASVATQVASAISNPRIAGAPATNTYQFLTTDILTGQILADNLPIIGQNATRQINAVGSFQGMLALQTANSQMTELGLDPVTISQMVQTWVNALIPYKSILWILQNGFPIFNGPVTAFTPNSIMDGQLPIQAASMEQIFQYRVNSETLTYNNVDVFEIFRQELQYAVSKKPNGIIAGTGQYANQSGIIASSVYSGIQASIQEQAGYQSIYDDWNDLVTGYGLEFALSPAITDSGSLYTKVELGLPQMGRLFANTGLTFVFPGQGMVDYAWQWVPQAPANSVTVTGQGSDQTEIPIKIKGITVGYTAFPTNAKNKTYTATAQATSELNAGWPLLEQVSSFWGSVTSQKQLNQYATQLLYTTAVHKSLNPIFTLSAQAPVQIKDTQLGDEVYVSATSPLHPAQVGVPGDVLGISTWLNIPINEAAQPGAPGVTALLRIISWSLTFPNGSTPEETQFTLGGLQIGPTP